DPAGSRHSAVTRARTGAAWCAALVVLAAPPAAGQGGGGWIASVGIGALEQRVDAGYGLEKYSGQALEVGVGGRPGARWTVQLRGLGGELQAANAADLDRRVGEAEALAGYKVASLWGFYGGVTVRAISNDAGRQRWVVGRIGAEVRPAFSGERLHAVG